MSREDTRELWGARGLSTRSRDRFGLSLAALWAHHGTAVHLTAPASAIGHLNYQSHAQFNSSFYEQNVLRTARNTP